MTTSRPIKKDLVKIVNKDYGLSHKYIAEKIEDYLEIHTLKGGDAKEFINAQNPEEKNATALISFAKMGNLEAVKTLIPLGANPDAVDTDNNSALHVATMLPKSQEPTINALVKVLVRAGADVNLVNADDKTVLMLAAKKWIT